MRRIPSPLSLALVVLACAVLAGCNGPSRRHRGEGELDGPKPVAMRGDTTYFDGKVHAIMTVSRGRAVPFADKDEGGRRDEGGGGGHRGYGHRRGGGDEGGYSGSEDSDERRRPLQWGLAPAVTLRLKLENASHEKMEVEIRDVNSDLGDFATRPDRVALEPGQSAELDPMISELGVTSDVIPVTVVLRAKGQTEKHEIVLKNLFMPASEK